MQGEPGPIGPNGKTETGASSGYYVVRHSQNSFVPACPRDYEVMWEGYSLMYTVGNGFAHSQDLGDAGSCSRSFRFEFDLIECVQISQQLLLSIRNLFEVHTI